MRRFPAIIFGIAALLVTAAGAGIVLERITGDEPSEPPPGQARQAQSPAGAGRRDAAPLALAGASATKNTTRLGGRDAVDDAAVVAGAVFPAGSARERPRAVTLVDARDWQAGIAAGMLAAAPVGAPVLLSEGPGLPPVTRSALTRLAPRGVPALERAQVIRLGARPPVPPGVRTRTIRGGDAYELAAAVDAAFSRAKGELSKQVMIVSGERPGHGLPAAAWAARAGDSVLFTRRERVPAATVRALRQRRGPQIYLLGPKSEIGPSAEQRLRALGRVRRIAGPTPADTAVAFARFRTTGFGWGIDVPGASFTLASSARPLDAAAAAALGSNGVFAPLLLTASPRALPRALESYLLDVQPGFEGDPRDAVFNRVWVLGDQSAVSARAQARLDELTTLVPVDPR